MRIAILQADTIHPALQSICQSYGLMFKQLLSKAAEQLALPLTLEVFDVVQGEYPATESFDAYLVTGSKADAFSDQDWVVALRQRVQNYYQQRKVLLGICFGHQLIAHALGGVTARSDKGWGVGCHTYQVQQFPSWWSGNSSQVRLLVSHQDQVQSLPESATLFLRSDFCPYAAFYIQQQVLCFQGHPEFTQAFAEGLLNTRLDRYSPSLVAEAKDSYVDGHDGALVAAAMLRFVQQAMLINTSAVNESPMSSKTAAYGRKL